MSGNSDLVKSSWGPGLIGIGISSLMYGASLAQSSHYVSCFPNDRGSIKLLVLIVFIADLLHLIGISKFYWSLLVVCHRSSSTTCERDLTWGATLAVGMNYIVTFAVQGFYCHRIWIISGGKRCITSIVFVIAVIQLVIGTWTSLECVKHGTIKYLYTTPTIPIAAGVSTVCDIIITITVFKYLWRSELRGRTNVLRDLVVVFINMGALTCLVSIAIGIVYLAQGNHYLVGAPGVVLSRCYVNSLLAVLNARRRIRERELRRFRYTVEVPTLTTLSIP